jgi:hypothetical protein
MKYRAFIFLLIVVFFVATHFVSAQSTSIYGGINDVSVSSFPENPGANQDVSFKIQSFLINLQTADISWSIDGKIVQHGIGMTSFKFTTKDVGQSTVVGLSILPIGGAPINKTLTITPSSLDILWEATDSATPPFYKGKALPTSESILKFVAMPNIKNNTGLIINPNDLVYSWTNDYELDKNSSGYGHNTYSIKMAITHDSENVGVTAQTRGGGLSAQKQVVVKTYEPKIAWYLTSTLYGPQFERAIDNGYAISSNDVSIFAQPYYISPRDITANNLKYSWTLNNEDLDAQTPPNILFLHRNNSNVGDARIAVLVENSKKYLQEIKGSITLHLQ